MGLMRTSSGWRVWAAVVLAAGMVRGGAAAGQAAASAEVAPGQGEVVDRVIAVVNGDLVLESDVDEERRFSAFQLYRVAPGPTTRQNVIERLIDRTLIQQQEKLQMEKPVTDAEVEAQLATLRKDIPACKEYHCETDAGWQKFVEAQGFTVDDLRERWRDRMDVLRFIEMRFRMGMTIKPEEIKAYYDASFVPEFTKLKLTPPKLTDVSDRIQEVLLQQRVGALLNDWLTSLKAQGSVHIMKPGEEAP